MWAPQLPNQSGNASAEQPGSELQRWLAECSQEDLCNIVGWNHFNGKVRHKIPVCGKQSPSQQNVIFDENRFPNAKSMILTLFRLNILSSYLKMARYITWNEKGIWTKHFSLKCKLSEFCYISNWLLWVGVLFHAGTRYFSCCILKAEFPSKGRIPGSVTL